MKLEFEDITKVSKKITDLVRNWRNSEDIKKNMINDHHISQEEHKEWLKNLKTEKNAKAWVINCDNKPIGLVYLLNINYDKKVTDWGLYIADKSFKNRGIGLVSIKKLINYIFIEMNFNKMTTKVLENNVVAINLYKKLGFKTVGTLPEKIKRNDKQIEIFLMSLSNDEWKKNKTKRNS